MIFGSKRWIFYREVTYYFSEGHYGRVILFVEREGDEGLWCKYFSNDCQYLCSCFGVNFSEFVNQS